MASCPEPDRLSRFVDDTLDEAERAAIESHIEECDDCRPAVALLAKTSRDDPPPRPSGLEVTLPATALDATVDAAARDPLRATAIDSAATLDSLAITGRRSRAPRKFDRYELRDVLGAGGMGIVYSARDPALERVVAIKVLRHDFATREPDAARRIVHEAQVMARISHPNVVNVFDVGKFEDQVFITMELVTGGSLKHWLLRHGRSVAEIVEAFVAAGRGLIAAHDAGVVHRDFKPDNVLVGHDGRIRVTDFGLAHDPGGGEADSDGAPRIAGTPGYMAPEQFEGGNVDARTDQFSFSVALYEALYGERPFKGTSLVEIGDAVVHGRVEPPPAGTRVPASLRAILLRGISVAPGDRFPTLYDLLVALGRDRGRRPRQIAVASAIALVSVAVGLGADTIVRDRTEAVARTSFAATHAQLDKLIALRTEAFVSRSDVLYTLPALREVAATHHQSDFGLAQPSDETAFDRIHDKLASASWLALASIEPGDELAIADEKGQLLYNTVAPEIWGTTITTVPAIAAAYDATTDTSIGVVRADDPAVVTTGVLGDHARSGLYVVFARVKVESGHPRAAFVQLVPSERLLKEVAVEDDADPTFLSVVAPDGTTEGTVPGELVPLASGGVTEVISGDATWLVQRAPLRAAGQRAGISHMVLARRDDAGLAGLFPWARLVLALTAVLLALVAVGCAVLARLRDLTRRSGRIATAVEDE